MEKNTKIAFAGALLACIIWAGNFAIARGVHDWIDPFTLSFYRWLVALVAILPFSYRHVVREWPVIRKHWGYFTLMGFFSVCVFNSLVYTAAQYTTTHHISLISATSPIWTLVLVGALGIEKLSRYKVGGAILALSGALVIICNGEPAQLFSQGWNQGDLLLVISSLIWAVYSVGLQFKPQGISSWTLLTTMIIIGLAFLLPCYLWELSQGSVTPLNLKAWMIYGYIGVLGSVVAWLMWNYSIQAVGSVKTGLVYYTIPVFSSIMAIAWLDEPIEAYHLLGFALVCFGIIVSNLRKLGIVKR